MAEFEKFKFKNKEELLQKIEELNLKQSVFWSDDLKILQTALVNDRLTIPNRMAVHPMEGLDGREDGAPGDLTKARYLNFARGGAGLIWWEATSIVPEGKSNKNQLYLNPENKDKFARLVAEVNETAEKVNGYRPLNFLQLNHSGRYSAPVNKKMPLFLFNDPYSDEKAGISEDSQPVKDDYLEKLKDKYITAARLAEEAGFDGVDIKACHRYLLSELLAAYTREGKFGGSYANRTELIRSIVAELKSLLPDFLIAIRLNVYDAIPYPYGWGVDRENQEIPDLTEPDLTEPVKLVQALAEENVEIFSITAADPRIHPHIVRPFNNSIKGGAQPPEHPLEGAARMFTLTAEIKKEIPDKIVLGAGYSWLNQFFPNVAAGNLENKRADLVGVGRMAFAYPDFARDILSGEQLRKEQGCIACSKCSELMIAGGPTGCVVRKQKPYRELYQKKVKGKVE